MRRFTSKNLLQKIIIALFILISISTIFTKPVNAIDLEKLGGQILDPFLSLFVAVGDGVMGLLQETILGVEESIINVDSTADFWSKVIVIVIAIVATAICIASVILTAGTGTIALIATGLNVAKVILVAAGVTAMAFPVATTIVEGWFPENFYLPLYEVTPYEIFSNKLHVLDVNFFEPMPDYVETDANVVKELMKTESSGGKNWYILSDGSKYENTNSQLEKMTQDYGAQVIAQESRNY